MKDLSPDEELLVDTYRATKRVGHSEGEWACKDGKLVKLWATDKKDVEQELRRVMRLREQKI